MANVLLVLSFLFKAAGFIGTLNAIPGVSPTTGVIIFFIASMVKDSVERIGDFLDHGKSDWRA